MPYTEVISIVRASKDEEELYAAVIYKVHLQDFSQSHSAVIDLTETAAIELVQRLSTIMAKRQIDRDQPRTRMRRE